MEFFVALLVALLVGCRGGSSPAPATIAFTDDAGQPVALAAPAARIVSLVPSATETLVALQARDRIVGRTRYDRDTSLARIADLGGGLDPNVEAIVGLRPDLVITFAGDARGDLRNRLAAAGIATLALRLEDTTDAFRSFATLARVLGDEARGRRLAESVRGELRAVQARAAGPRPRVFYVVFNDPPMTAGPNTFIGQLLEVAGAENIFADAGTNWPTIAMEELVQRAPEAIVLPTGEMRDAALAKLRTTPGWSSLQAMRDGRVIFVDGDLVNRPGARMGQAARAFQDGLGIGSAAPR